MTEDPVEPPLVPDRHVHHRCDAVQLEIGFAQLAGAHVGARLVRRDDTVFGDGGEIARVVARSQDLAGLVSTLGANEVVLTHDRASVGEQPPNAGPFDVEGDRRRLGDSAERLGHIGLVALGQLEEHLLSTASGRAVALIGPAHVSLGLRCPSSRHLVTPVSGCRSGSPPQNLPVAAAYPENRRSIFDTYLPTCAGKFPKRSPACYAD